MRHSLIAIAAVIFASTLGLGGAAFAPSSSGGDATISEPPATTKPDGDKKKRGRKGRRGRKRTDAPTSAPTSGPTTAPTSAPSSQPTTTTTSSGPATQPTSQPDEKKDSYFVLTGGIIHTVAGPDLQDATVLCKNGVIQAIGRSLAVPEDAEILDVSGMHVYPGLVACSSRGIVGSEPPENSTDVFGTNMTLALSGGLSTVVTGNTAAKTTFGTLEGHVLRKDLFVKLSFATGAQKHKVREVLGKVRQYLRDKAAYDKKKADGDGEDDEDAEAPDEGLVKGGNAKYLQLIKKEKTALIQADAQHDLVDVCRLAQDFGIRIVVRGANEGWTVPGLLGRADVKVIVTPRSLPGKNEQINRPTGGSIENAAVMYDHGVDIAVTTGSANVSLRGIAGRDLLNLPMEAAYAVRGGLPEAAAVESITLGAARVLGIADRVGSIEVGKDADFTVCDGEVLDFFTTVQWTIVNGRVAYDKKAESLFGHIRPRTPTTQPAPYKFWPRPFRRPAASE